MAENPIKLEPEAGGCSNLIVLDGKEGSVDNPIIL